MKKILSLTGIQQLSKKHQQQITGSNRPYVYCGPPKQCCQMVNGVEYCDYGYCQPYGRCIWA
ncbi:hypothetical protein ACWGOQ_0022890 [Aquimarina sp. M1]